jgi:serine/threonine protein phosphatase PrpC
VKLRAFGLSDVGRVRDSNEDQFLVDESVGLYAVADGMGGHAAGEIASEIAIQTLAESIRKACEGAPTAGSAQAKESLEHALASANRLICESTAGHDERRGMGTTVVAMLALRDRAVIAHVGDSRAYLLRDGKLRLLTSDHSWVNEQVRMGILSPADANRHPMRNVVTRALGTRGDVRPDVLDEPLEPHDALLLCSDGLNVMLGDDRIRDILLGANGDPEVACRSLVAAANDEGGDDNTTVIVITAV